VLLAPGALELVVRVPLLGDPRQAGLVHTAGWDDFEQAILPQRQQDQQIALKELPIAGGHLLRRGGGRQVQPGLAFRRRRQQRQQIGWYSVCPAAF
jgi:hypothetical protein